MKPVVLWDDVLTAESRWLERSKITLRSSSPTCCAVRELVDLAYGTFFLPVLHCIQQLERKWLAVTSWGPRDISVWRNVAELSRDRRSRWQRQQQQQQQHVGDGVVGEVIVITSGMWDDVVSQCLAARLQCVAVWIWAGHWLGRPAAATQDRLLRTLQVRPSLSSHLSSHLRTFFL